MFSGKRLARLWPRRSSSSTAAAAATPQQESTSRSSAVKGGQTMRSRSESDRTNQSAVTTCSHDNTQKELEVKLERLRQDYIKLEETVHSLMPYRNQAEVLEKRLSNLYKTIDRERSEREETISALTAENEQLRLELGKLKSECSGCSFCLSQNADSRPPTAAPSSTVQSQAADVVEALQPLQVLGVTAQDLPHHQDDVILSSENSNQAPPTTDRVLQFGPRSDFHNDVGVSGDGFQVSKSSQPHPGADKITQPSPGGQTSAHMEPARITWLLGDGDLDWTESTFLTSQTKSSTSTRRADLAGDDKEQREVRTLESNPPDDAESGRRVVEELVGSVSPLANLPLETDVDALIDMLRTSPTISSKTISRTSTISINDILDDDSEHCLDESLSSYSFDDEEDTGRRFTGSHVQTVRKSHLEATTFRNSDQQYFGFGLDAPESERMEAINTSQLTASPGGLPPADISDDKQRKLPNTSFSDDLTPVQDIREGGQHPDSTAPDASPVETRLLYDEAACKEDNVRQTADEDTVEDVVITYSTLLEKPSEHCVDAEPTGNSEEIPQRVENPDSIASMVTVSGETVNLDDQDGEFSSRCLDSSFNRVHYHSDDGSSQTTPTVETHQGHLDDHNAEKLELASSDFRSQKVNKVRELPVDRSSISTVTSTFPEKPAVRRKSCDWKPSEEMPRKSEVAVGKDSVTALTAYFEEVHADQCPGCEVCLSGTVQRPFVIHRRSSLPTGFETRSLTRTDWTSRQYSKNSDLAQTELAFQRDSSQQQSMQTSTSSQQQIVASNSANKTLNYRLDKPRSLPSSEGRQQSHHQKDDSGLLDQSLDSDQQTSSRRVVSLPDISTGSSVTSRGGRKPASFRFRVAKVRSHSLRSFSVLTPSPGAAAAETVTNSRDRQPTGQRPVIDHIHSRVHSFPASVISDSTPVNSAVEDGRPVEEAGIQDQSVATSSQPAFDSQSFENLLVQLLNPGLADHGNSLTPDAIRKYRIQPARRGPPPPPPPRRGSKVGGTRTDRRATSCEMARSKSDHLEQRIDAMLFDRESRWSDVDRNRRSQRNVRTTTVPATHTHLNSSCTPSHLQAVQSPRGRYGGVTVKPPRPPVRHARSPRSEDELYDDMSATFSFPDTRVRLPQPPTRHEDRWIPSDYPESIERSSSFQRWVPAQRHRLSGTTGSKQLAALDYRAGRRVSEPIYHDPGMTPDQVSVHGDLSVCIGLTVQCSPVGITAVRASAPPSVNYTRRQPAPRCGATVVDHGAVTSRRNQRPVSLTGVRSSDDIHVGLPPGQCTRRENRQQFIDQQVAAVDSRRRSLDDIRPKFRQNRQSHPPVVEHSEPQRRGRREFRGSYWHGGTVDWKAPESRRTTAVEDFAVGFENETSTPAVEDTDRVPDVLARSWQGQSGFVDKEEELAFDEITEQIASLTQTVNELRFKHRRPLIIQSDDSVADTSSYAAFRARRQR